MITATISHLALQQYWWVIIALLAGLLVFLLFVQGGQSLIFGMTKDGKERTMMLNAMGRKWEFTFTTLVTFGGAFFASFPLFYATSFGGAYWAWIALLLSFTIQAFSYEYRNQKGNIFGKRFFEILLWINGTFAPFLLGVIVASMFTGSAFVIEKIDLHQSYWQNQWHGLEALADWRNLILGFAVLFLSRVSGILYFIHTIDDESLLSKLRKQLWYNAIPFVIFFLTFMAIILTKEGFAVNPETGEVSMEAYKYLHNFLQMPLVLILFLIGVLAVLAGIIRSIFVKSCDKAFWVTGPGIVLVVMTLFFVLGLNNTAFYPSVADLNSSLTIQNASSSLFTLKTMSIVSLLIPFVLGYIIIAWRSINSKKIDRDEMEDLDGGHVY
ncbi:MAG: cytochrome d ubiquinol oxidase subunit II [Bacteroidales bacterium]|jgi:cytochrome d ubiquinol oxidase subunit II|nr:cytochrome d ubiquinol oxidase subunit II [Bacteroidales bacterium]